MASRKQVIYTRLLRDGILGLRFLCAMGSRATAEQLPRLREALEAGWEQANFLHRVHGSILEPGYVDNDITFINLAFPCPIERLGEHLGAETAALMLEFYEDVPGELRSQLCWHPSTEFRSLAEQSQAEPTAPLRACS